MANERKVPFIITADDQASKKFDGLKSKVGGLDGAFGKLSNSLLSKFSPQMQGALFGLGGAIGNLKQKMSNIPVFQGAVIGAGLAMTAKGLVDNAVATTDQLGRLNDLNQMYGISTDLLQSYSVVAKASGTDIEAVAKSYGKLKENLLAAQQGDQAKILEFRAVGITADDLKKPSEDVMAKIATVFKESTKDMDDELKSTFAKQIFGKAGADIIPFLNEGGAKFKETTELLRKQNRLFSGEQIKQADEVGDRWADSVDKIGNLKQKIGIAMLPMLTSMSDAIDKAFDSKQNPELVKTFEQLGKSIGESAPKIIEALPQIIEGLAKLIEKLVEIGDFVGWDNLVLGSAILFAAPFAASMLDIGVAIFGVVRKLGVLIATNAVVAASNAGLTISFYSVSYAAGAAWAAITGPIGLVIAAIALVGTGIYLIWKNWDTVKEYIDIVWTAIKMFAADAWESLKNIGKGIVEFLLSPFNNLIDVINLAIEGFNSISGTEIKLIPKIEPFANESGLPMQTISDSSLGGAVSAAQTQKIESKVGGELKISIDNPAARVDNISTTPNFGLKVNTGAVL